MEGQNCWFMFYVLPSGGRDKIWSLTFLSKKAGAASIILVKEGVIVGGRMLVWMLGRSALLAVALLSIFLNRNLGPRTLEGHSGFVESIAFSPDGHTLASGSNDSTIKLWDPAAGTLLRSLEGHAHIVDSVAFSPDRQTLASGSSENTIKLWRVARP